MDHLSHSLSDQSQTTYLQPHLHRRSQPTTLRSQGRLSRRILRGHSQHCRPSDLRGHLRTSAAIVRNGTPEGSIALVRNCIRSATGSPHSKIPATLSRPQQSQPWTTLFLTAWNSEKFFDPLTAQNGHDFVFEPSFRQRSVAEDLPGFYYHPERSNIIREADDIAESKDCPELVEGDLLSALRQQPLVPNCEYTGELLLWKKNLISRTKPAITGDTTYGVYLLTGTISGSNFAFPRAFETWFRGNDPVSI